MQVYEPQLITQVWGVTQLTVLASATGWATGRVVDLGVSGSLIPILAGVAGLALAPYVSHLVGGIGPSLAGYSLPGLFISSLIACGFVKLLSVGLNAGLRR